MEILTEQELHNLAMNHVGKELENQGFEFIAVNSQLKRHPQFVCVDKPTNTLHFVLVTVFNYPNNPEEYDAIWMETFIEHATKLKAKVLYAGVGIANASDYEKPVIKNEDYIINYNGIKEIN
ncbi:MAG: Na(+)-translocating NADH-quinone reductase subunit F [Flavobacterium sp.]|nr:Na(+)-translocating NADH-quinone reductase subunit F [Flavobacterium sp.]